MWVKAALRIVAGLAIIIVAFAIYDVATYDRSAWRRDYEHLKREMAQRYANLDWMVSHRRMNLRALDAETTSAIDGAVSHVQAFLALRDFIRAFRDPHLRLVWRNGPRIGEWKLRDRQLIGSCEDARYGKKPPGYLFDRFADLMAAHGARRA